PSEALFHLHIVFNPVENRGVLRLPVQFAARLGGGYAAVGAEGVDGVTETPFLDRFFHRPRLRCAQLQAPGDGGDDIGIRGFAVLDEVERAGRRLLQCQQIQFDDVRDMDVGPDVDTLADVTRDAAFLRLRHQRRNLHAVRAGTEAGTVDHRVAQDDRAHAALRRIENQLVERGARRLFRDDVDRRIFGKDL